MSKKDVLEVSTGFYMDIALMLTIFLTIIVVWLFNNYPNESFSITYLIAIIGGWAVFGAILIFRFKVNSSIKQLANLK